MIKTSRRAVLLAGFAALAGALGPSLASADDYPSRPIQLVVAYPPGGGTDTVARLLASELSKQLHQPVVVNNRPGAAGVIGTAAVARAAADGYTLLLDTGNSTLRPAVEPKTSFRPSDFEPIALLSYSPTALAVAASLPVNSVAELIAYSRANAGKINYASTGKGSPQHLITELMKVNADLDWVQVPYQGGSPALIDLTAGRVQLMFSNPVPLMPHVEAQRLKVLAVTWRERLPALPEVPTMAESGVEDFVIGFWNGVLAPAGTPAAIVSKLSQALLKIMSMPHVNAALVEQGSVPMPLGVEAFAKYMTEDSERWESLAKTIKYEPTQ